MFRKKRVWKIQGGFVVENLRSYDLRSLQATTPSEIIILRNPSLWHIY